MSTHDKSSRQGIAILNILQEMMDRSALAHEVESALRDHMPQLREILSAPSAKKPTEWCKAKEFGCECGRSEYEPCPLRHPRSISTLDEALRRCADYHGDDALLDAPCIFCFYNGADYWQKGTHAKDCRWHTVGGFEDRRKALVRRSDGKGHP